MKIYTSQQRDIALPDLDLLTFFFESSWCAASEDTVIHAEAENTSNGITKSEARDLLRRIAHGLRSRYGVGEDGPGKNVVLCMSSGNAFIPIIFYSIVAAGGVFSSASTAFTVSELTRQIKMAGNSVRALVCSAEFEQQMILAAQNCNISLEKVLVMDFGTPQHWRLKPVTKGYGFPDVSSKMLEWQRITTREQLENTTICLLYSSGTTGLPKGVLLSHWNCVAGNICSMQTGRSYLQKRQQHNNNEPFHFRTIAHLPMAHIAGIQQYCLNPFYYGGTTYWMTKFELSKFLEYSKRFRTTYQFTVPPIWLQIAKSPTVTDHFDSLEVAVSGAAPMGLELQKEVSSKLGQGRIFLSQTWGTTETCGSITALPWDQKDETGSVGDIIANVKLRLTDDNGKDVGQGMPGEVLVAGPIVSNGYHNNAEATTTAFSMDHECPPGADAETVWYHTGDVGIYRNNLIYIVDRKKELIKYKGLQVAPAELEALLLSNPQILDAAVIGVESQEFQTEVPKAYIVRASSDSPTTQITEEEIKVFVKQNLASHKQLRGGVVFVKEIPKSASGKILRKELRAQHQRSQNDGKAKL